MSALASQITSLTIVSLIVYSGTDQRKYQSSASLAFVWGIHCWPVNSPHKGPVTWKMFPFEDFIMIYICREKLSLCYVDTPQFWSLLVFLSPGWHLTLVIQSTCPANILLESSCGNVSPRDRKMMSPGYWDRVLSSHHDWEEYFWTRISIFYLQFLIEIDTKIILNQLWVY